MTVSTYQNVISVLTGDIVNSRKLSEEERKLLYQELLHLSSQLQFNHSDTILYPMSIFRGDSWQLILAHPEKSLEICMLIRTYIISRFPTRKIDSRVAIGIGKVNFIPTENAAAGDGPAFLLSGILLESMGYERMAIGFDLKQDLIETTTICSLVSLIDQIVTGWSASQAQAVFLTMQGKNQSESAQEWEPQAISQTAVSKNLKASGWKNVKKNLLVFAMLVKYIIEAEEK